MVYVVGVLWALVVSCSLWQLHAYHMVDKSRLALTSVPQNVDVNVQHFKLIGNYIKEIDSTSFPLYIHLKFLDLSDNPLTHIRDDTFRNSPLRLFYCKYCSIKSLPLEFGLDVTAMRDFTLYDGIDSSVANTIFKYPYFEAFTSLRYIGLSNLPLKDSIANLKLPASLEVWHVVSAEISSFPNLTSSVFPKLKHIIMHRNGINVVEETIWARVSDTLQSFVAYSNQFAMVANLALKPNLQRIDISDNQLETIPDLLDMIYLTELKIGGNSHMACDRRMCWRRLWDRVRAPLVESDDVICVQPPELAGLKLSTVNPKLMECDKGTTCTIYPGAFS